MVEQLGFRMAGTTDAALVLTQAVESGLPSTTSKWLWELKRQLKASSAVTGVAAAVTAEAAHLPDAPDQPKSSAVDASADAKVRFFHYGLALRPSNNGAHFIASQLLSDKERCTYLFWNNAAEHSIIQN